MTEFEEFAHKLLNKFIDACEAQGLSALETEQLAFAMAQSIVLYLCVFGNPLRKGDSK